MIVAPEGASIISVVWAGRRFLFVVAGVRGVEMSVYEEGLLGAREGGRVGVVWVGVAWRGFLGVGIVSGESGGFGMRM